MAWNGIVDWLSASASLNHSLVAVTYRGCTAHPGAPTGRSAVQTVVMGCLAAAAAFGLARLFA